MRWETKWSFDGKLCLEFLCQKLSKSDNWFSRYSRKCRGCFFGTQCIKAFHLHSFSRKSCHINTVLSKVNKFLGYFLHKFHESQFNMRSASDSAYSYTLLHRVVCLSVVCLPHSRTLLKSLDGLQLHNDTMSLC